MEDKVCVAQIVGFADTDDPKGEGLEMFKNYFLSQICEKNNRHGGIELVDITVEAHPKEPNRMTSFWIYFKTDSLPGFTNSNDQIDPPKNSEAQDKDKVWLF